MFAILHVLWIFVVDIFKSRRRLEAENLFLHHQLNIAVRRAPPRLRLYGSDLKSRHWSARIECPLRAKSGLMQRSKVEEIQGVQRPLSVNLSPCAHAVRSTRRTPTDFKSV